MLNTKTKALQTKVADAVKDLHELSQEIGHKDLTITVGELRNRMNDPFMFVIVGEVKAGKSSFINALLESGEICKVAPQPMTDTVQQIFYGETEEVTVINDYLKRITLPIEILKEVAIVDTPGTNSIVEKHQEVTEKFIPASDLVVFVFEAKNPYRQSSWDFFDYIHRDWHKKIIFVLQQKDLMSPEDLSVNERGLFEFAERKGIQNPTIFTSSAKMEIEGKYDQSGFSGIRDYIRTHVTGGRGAALKIRNNIETCMTILERIQNDLHARGEQYRADITFRDEVRAILSNQETKSVNHANTLIENLLNGYDKITKNTGEELEASLSFPSMLKRSIMGIFNKQTSITENLDAISKKMEVNLNAELRTKLNDGVVDLADSIQQMAKMIDLKIQNSKTVMHSDRYIFEDIAERRSKVLKELQEDFSRFMARSESFKDDRLFPSNTAVSPNIAAGSGVAIIGMVLAAVTNITVLDITGGILTTVGFMFAGITAGVQRKKIVNGYYEEIAKGRKLMEASLEEKLITYIRTIKGRISDNFVNLDALLENENAQLDKLNDRFHSISTRLKGIEQEVRVD